MLSPTLHRRTRISRDGDAVSSASARSRSGVRVLPYQGRGTESTDLDSALCTDRDTTSKGQHADRMSDFRRRDRELSPSVAHLERRHGSVNPPQPHPAPPDSSSPQFTPHKRLFVPFTADEDDSENLTGYSSELAGPGSIPGPASAPPVPSSPPPRTHHRPTDMGPALRGGQPLPSEGAQQHHVGRPAPLPLPSRATQPTRTFVPAPQFRRGAPRRHITGRPPGEERMTATPKEWRRDPANNDELLLIILRASKMGVRDHEEAFRNAGMDEGQARAARQQYDELCRRGMDSDGASFAAPPLHIHPGLATGATSGGAMANGSRPPRMSAAQTASDSDSLYDDYPDSALSPTALESASDVQVNRLAEGIENLDVTNVPGNSGGTERDLDLSWYRENLYNFIDLAHQNRGRVFRALGMDARQTEGAYKGYVLKAGAANDWKDREGHVFRNFLVSRGATTANIDEAVEGLADGQRRAMARSDAPSLPRPSDRGREVPPIRQIRNPFSVCVLSMYLLRSDIH